MAHRWTPETFSLSTGCAMRLLPLAQMLAPSDSSDSEVRNVLEWLRTEVNTGWIPAANISDAPQKRLVIVPPAGQMEARRRFALYQRERLAAVLSEAQKLLGQLQKEDAA